MYRYQQAVAGGTGGAANAGGGGGGGTDTATAAGFSDRVELAQAQNDPRYDEYLESGNRNPKFSKAFTDQVNQRLLNTSFINKGRRR